MKNKTTFKIVLSSLLLAILFVQEEVLSFLPGIQFTFLLLFVYGAVLDFKWGSLIVIAHVILDNLIMGSFVVHIIIPMFVGYYLSFIFGYLAKKRIILTSFLCALSIIIYTLAFALSSVIIYHIDYFVYMASDIPYTIILICFSVITIIWLYNPLVKVLEKIITKQKNSF